MLIKGYLRENGQVGIRNHLLILATVNCANSVVRGIASQLPKAIGIQHQQGCSQLGADHIQTFRTLAGTGMNPNVGAVLVVGLGCEVVAAADLAQEISKSGKPVEYLVIQESGGFARSIAKGIDIAQKLFLKIDGLERRELSMDSIIVATECGGSDFASGLSANPATGVMSDLVVHHGGTVILSETTEFIGAEHVLAKRAATPEIGEQIIRIVDDFEQRAKAMKVDIRGGQPSPGNIAGGLTTIEEKSLGCIYKGGTTIINEVVNYGQVPQSKGLVIMDTPGNDVESITGMVAGGAQVVVFTTGRGTPAGSPIAPVIKVCSNNRTFKNLEDIFDINAGTILEGQEDIQGVGERIFNKLVQTINGKLTKSEIYEQMDFNINRIGLTL